MTNILIVDDDATFRKLLEVRLRSFLGKDAVFEQRASVSELSSFASELTSRGETLDLVILDQHLRDGRGLDFLASNPFPDTSVLLLTSDTGPDVAGQAVQAGAAFFLGKHQISEALFRPLILGLMERNRLTREIQRLKQVEIQQETVRTLVATLRHEINNPLGVVLGANFLVQQSGDLNEKQRRAAELVEASGQRIREVVSKLAEATSIHSTIKSGVVVFQVPGDKEWEKE